MHDEGFHYIDDIHSRDKAITSSWKSFTIFFLYLILANRQQYHNNPRDMGDEK